MARGDTVEAAHLLDHEVGHMRILHVTEAMGGGIVTVLESFSRKQAELGHTVEVLYVRRAESPPADVLRQRFDSRVELTEVQRSGGGLKTLFELYALLKKRYRTNAPDIVHLHSSHAGGVGRLATFAMRQRPRVVYSPHGFGFLRQDMSNLVSRAVTVAERVLLRLGDGIILTAPSEEKAAITALHLRETWLVQTGITPQQVRSTPRQARSEARATVVMVGRVTFQKAPWRFTEVAKALSTEADFIWIGDGPAEDVSKWLDTRFLTVAGWLSPEELAQLLERADILLFPTLWEGMPLSLLQAQGDGIPAVVSDSVGNVDGVEDGRTGFVCATDEMLVSRTANLVRDRTLWKSMSDEAITWARESLTDEKLGSQSIAIYERVLDKA